MSVAARARAFSRSHVLIAQQVCPQNRQQLDHRFGFLFFQGYDRRERELPRRRPCFLVSHVVWVSLLLSYARMIPFLPPLEIERKYIAILYYTHGAPSYTSLLTLIPPPDSSCLMAQTNLVVACIMDQTKYK